MGAPLQTYTSVEYRREKGKRGEEDAEDNKEEV